MKHFKLLSTIAAAGALLGPVMAQAAVCPAIGVAPGCNVLFTIGSGNTVTGSIVDPNPYDGIEDTMVGVVNNSGATISSLFLSGSNIFGFDGDGQNAYTGNTYGTSGYEGPNTSFSITDYSNGSVLFTGGLASGQSAWFTLEEGPSSITLGSVVVTSSVPEPETLALFLAGMGVVGSLARRRKSKQA